MKQGDKFKVQSEEFFDNLTKVLYKEGTMNHDRFVKEHRKYAGQILTITEKVGFCYAVEENDLLWDSGNMVGFYTHEGEV